MDWWTLVRILGFSPRVWFMKFQTANTSVMVWFWINSMLVFEVLWNGEVV